MKSKDQTLLEEAYEQIRESTGLRDPNLSQQQAQKLIDQDKELKDSIQSLVDRMKSPTYHYDVDPEGRMFDAKRLKELRLKRANVRKRYYGN